MRKDLSGLTFERKNSSFQGIFKRQVQMKSLLEQIESRLAVCAKATPGTKPKFMELKRFLDSSRNQREGELAALKVAVNYLDSLRDNRPKEQVWLFAEEALAQITKLMGEGK